jgi:DnaK suppressor protein
MDSYADIREALERRSERLGRRVEGLEQGLVRERGRPGAIGGAAHPEAVAEIAEAARGEIALVHGALARMRAGTYGRCGKCGGGIGLQRLRILPYSERCEACAPGVDFDALNRLRLEHLELRRLVRALNALLGRGGARVPATARVLLGDLARELPEHFALEERGGYFADAVAAAPRLSRRAERLYREHAEFLRESRQLEQLARGAATRSELWDEIVRGWARLASRLAAHEQAENALVHEAFSEAPAAAD